MPCTDDKCCCDDRTAEFIRVPGLLRRWEMAELLEVGCDFHIEEAGHADDGTALFALYRRERPDKEE